MQLRLQLTTNISEELNSRLTSLGFGYSDYGATGYLGAIIDNVIDNFADSAGGYEYRSTF